MSEMLANRYFHAARFADAAAQYEGVLRRRPGHPDARKKLMVCYAMGGRLDDALDIAAGLLREAPDIFLDTDPQGEGFPCREIEALADRGAGDSVERAARLGLLYLFCDEPRAERELRSARETRGDLEALAAVHDLVLRHMEARHAR
jgi:hypothetical protein